MTSKNEHLWRTGLLLAATIAAACGVAFLDGEAQMIAIGVLSVAGGGLLDALRVLARGSGGDASLGMIVFAVLLVSGCATGYDVAAVAYASDRAEEHLCGRLDGPAGDACVTCVRAATDATICELDSDACAELR